MIKSILLDKNFLVAIISSVLLILLGFILKNKKIVNDKIKNLFCFIVLKISLPSMAFCAFLNDFNSQLFIDNIFVFIFTLLLYIVFLFMGRIIFFKYDKEKRRVYSIFIAVGQLTFFSIPVLKALYGDKIMITVNMVTLAFRFVLYVYCYFVISNLKFNKDNLKSSLKNFFLNPIMIAMFLGLFIWVFQNITWKVDINGVEYSFLRIDKTLPHIYIIFHFLQFLATPLAMLIIGFSLGESNIKESFRDKTAWLCACCRTFFVPIFSLVILILINSLNIYQVNELLASSIVIGFAAPLSAVVNTYCLKYKNEINCASRTCFLSTLLCIVTIPIIYILIKVFVEIGLFT